VTSKERREIKSKKEGFVLLIKDLIGLDNFDLSENFEEYYKKVLKTLSPMEEMVIKKRYGLLLGKALTLEEIAEHLLCSRERIRQIEAKALRKLKYPSRLRFLFKTIRKQLPQGVEPYSDIGFGYCHEYINFCEVSRHLLQNEFMLNISWIQNSET
jgi:DNA-binding CsgD family transcriptional regulator